MREPRSWSTSGPPVGPRRRDNCLHASDQFTARVARTTSPMFPKPGGIGRVETSVLETEPYRRARAGREMARGIAVDDGDLDPAGAPRECDQRARGLLSVGARQAFDPRAGEFDGPFLAGMAREVARVDVGDQVAEVVAKNPLAHVVEVVGG